MASSTMPVGSTMSLPIRQDQVTITEGNKEAPVLTEDAVANLVWNDYIRAKAYVESENTSWLLEWQETDILYQSPVPYRFERTQAGQPARVPRFLVAKWTRTMSRAVKRGLFAEQYPFFLRPGSRSSQESIDAWTYLIGVLLKRMKFKYHGGLQINGQTLFGTGIGKYGLDQRTYVKKTRRRVTPPQSVELPIAGEKKTVPTAQSDDFREHEESVTETYPFYEYRKLGTTLFDAKWCTPDQPDESAGYCVDIDFVNFYDLAQMRQLSCYRKSGGNPGIPDEKALLNYFFLKQEGDAPSGTQTEDTMSSTGSMAAHAAGRNRQTSIDPLTQPLMLIERWDDRTTKTILCYDGRKLTIRNESHDWETMCHTACTWWPIENSGYGMGIGRITGPDQRINAGVINAALKMIAYPMNAPILYNRQGENAPTQNTIWRHGGYQAVDPGPGGDVRKAMAFMDMPAVPADAWRMLDQSKSGGEELAGADAQTQRGLATGKQGIGRSAAGANRLSVMADQDTADPVDSFADGVIVPVIKFLIKVVKTKMPIKEIRQILSQKYSDEIVKSIDLDQLLADDFEVDVLAGQKLAAKQGIQQLIPFFLQIVQQPQLLEYLHQRGDTVDFKVIMDLLLQVSELSQQPDIFRRLSPRERAMVKQMTAGAQKLQAAVAQERMRGANRLQEIQKKGEVDLSNNLAEKAIDHISEGVPLARATGLVERTGDVHTLKEGLPDILGNQP